MNWKYYIPHIWDKSRQVWEDIYLLPNDPTYQGEALWLTIDALGDADEPSHGSQRVEFIGEALEKLGNENFWIDGTDMIIRARDFDKEEFFHWVRLWLEVRGFQVNELIEAPLEDFVGRCSHATLIHSLKMADENLSRY